MTSLSPYSEIRHHLKFLKNSRDPYEAIDTSHGSLGLLDLIISIKKEKEQIYDENSWKKGVKTRHFCPVFEKRQKDLF